MAKEEKKKYAAEELKEFEELILDKINKAQNELNILKQSLNRSGESGTGDTNVTSKVLEDGAETSQKESLNELAARQQKFINNLNNALVRIKNGTYGICKVTGKLIPKERLRAVPHTMLSIEAKLEEKK
jgi:RNA polymerase-binding transcription factor DksA